MSLNAVENIKTYIMPKTPKPRINIIPKNISYIKLIEVDDDSDSEQTQNKEMNLPNNNKKVQSNNDDILSDDQYEDSFDEEFGECETNPNSQKK